MAIEIDSHVSEISSFLDYTWVSGMVIHVSSLVYSTACGFCFLVEFQKGSENEKHHNYIYVLGEDLPIARRTTTADVI